MNERNLRVDLRYGRIEVGDRTGWRLASKDEVLSVDRTVIVAGDELRYP